MYLWVSVYVRNTLHVREYMYTTCIMNDSDVACKCICGCLYTWETRYMFVSICMLVLWILEMLHVDVFVSVCMHVPWMREMLHCSTLHRTAPHCTALHYTAPHRNALHHTAPRCNTLQRAATHYAALQPNKASKSRGSKNLGGAARAISKRNL